MVKRRNETEISFCRRRKAKRVGTLVSVSLFTTLFHPYPLGLQARINPRSRWNLTENATQLKLKRFWKIRTCCFSVHIHTRPTYTYIQINYIYMHIYMVFCWLMLLLLLCMWGYFWLYSTFWCFVLLGVCVCTCRV